MFHPSSGVSPFPSGSANPNPNPGSSFGFPFGWNWNSTNPHGQQNVGLAYTKLGPQMLGNNPSLGNVGGNASLGVQSRGNQGIPTPQHNLGFNPYFTQQVGGALVSSQPPLGPTQTPFNVQQPRGNNVPPNPFTNIGEVSQQLQQPINMGQTTSNMAYQQPSMGTSNVLFFVPPQGGSNYQSIWPQPGGTYEPCGNPNPSNIPIVLRF